MTNSMEKDKSKQMKKLGLMLLFLNIIPVIILLIGSFYWKTIIFLAAGFLFWMLWILTVVKRYVGKINQLKKEINTGNDI